MTHYRKIVLVLAVLFCNIFIKALFAGETSFWFDEIISIKDTKLEFGHIKHEAEWDNNPPFYYYVLWVWHRILSVSEFNSRLLSVLLVSFGIAGVVYLVAKRSGNLSAIVVATLLSTSNFLHYYSQEARAYALIFLLSTFSLILFSHYTETKNRKWLYWCAFVNFLLFYTHYIAALISVFQVLTLFVRRDRTANYYLLVSLVCTGGFSALRFTKKQWLHILGYNSDGQFWLRNATFQDLLKAFESLFDGYLTSIVFLIIISYILVRMARREMGADSFLIYSIFSSIGALLVLFLLAQFKAIFLDRYLIFILPSSAVLFGEVAGRSKVFLGLFMSLALLGIWHLRLHKKIGMDYKFVASVVKNTKREQDCVYLNTKGNLQLFAYYYDKSQYLRYKNIDSCMASINIYGFDNATECLKFSCDRVFIIQSFHLISDPQNIFLKSFLSRNKVIYSQNWIGEQFTVLSRKPNL